MGHHAVSHIQTAFICPGVGQGNLVSIEKTVLQTQNQQLAHSASQKVSDHIAVSNRLLQPGVSKYFAAATKH